MLSRILCKLGFHLPVYWSNGDAFYHHYRLITYDKVRCSLCKTQLQKPKKQLRLEADIELEVAKINEEIKKHGHPLLTGITLT